VTFRLAAADGRALPLKMDFGMSRWGGSKIRLHNYATKQKGHDRSWHKSEVSDRIDDVCSWM
jgi:hypothetical protein